MAVSKSQLKTLIELTFSVSDDDMDCDDCFNQIAMFAEIHIANQPLDAGMQAVQNHLDNCPCCQDEFNALLDAMMSMEQL